MTERNNTVERRAPYVLLVLLLASCSDEPIAVEESSLVFTDISLEAGLADFRHTNGGFGEALAPEIVGGGGGFVDYDSDGLVDIVLVGGGAFEEFPVAGPALRLYRNLGMGRFEEVTEESGLWLFRTYGFGVTAGDYDNDGDQDLFLTTLYSDLLLRNDDGVFVEAAREAGIGAIKEWSTSALFFDADLDGYLDLYVGTYVDWSPEKDQYCGFEGEKVYCTPELYDGIWGRYWHNNGDGTFTERTAESGFTSGIDAVRDKTLGVAELDADSDGWPDLVIANDTERDLLFVNNGDGTFTEFGIRSGIAFDQHGKPRAGMGIDVGVVDATGEQSVFVGNFSGETVGVYRHTGNGLFIDRAAVSRIGRPTMKTLTFGLFLFDVDLDADLDLFIANGHVQTHIEHIVEGITFRQLPQLFLNDGRGFFEELMQNRGILARKLVGRGAAYADIDRDGDLDVLVTENNGSAHLWRNDVTEGHWLRVTLEGRISNRDGYGTQVEVFTGGTSQVRRVRSGSSYLSHSDPAAVFGLGALERVDSLRVDWPSGIVDRFELLDADRHVHVIEGSTIQ